MTEIEIRLIPDREFRRIEKTELPVNEKLAVLADMCRLNALAVVKRAGSGHLGSTFSSMDLFVRLYYAVLNVRHVGFDSPDRDVFFSSKGHDCPGQYAVLHSLGVIADQPFVDLRRRAGLEGHPDVGTPGIETNTGSLGMGISKARGIVWAKNHLGYKGHVYVLTGDGEFQEGQNYEALQAVAHACQGPLTVIMDHNKVQSDKYVSTILSLGDMEAKLRAFGWHVLRCDGNAQDSLNAVFQRRQNIIGPAFIIADTLKGKGVSFMEHALCMTNDADSIYPWHAGAPGDEHYVAASREIAQRIAAILAACDIAAPETAAVAPPPKHDAVYTLEGEQVSVAVGQVSKGNSESMAAAYGRALLKAAETCRELVVLDADLAADCRVRDFEIRYPERFIECGIAEQDMVSMAGGLARQGLLPFVHSFASFLASRANEQIYNNATERSKIVYACHYAGLIPAGPGKSHQSLRDIGLLGGTPGFQIIEPCCPGEVDAVMDYAIRTASCNIAIRLPIGPSPRVLELPADYRFSPGRGFFLRDGQDAMLMAYGPVMLHEALVAADLLMGVGVGVAVVNMPWLNYIDMRWMATIVSSGRPLFVVEDHSPVGGLADRLMATLLSASPDRLPVMRVRGVNGIPAFGAPWEALSHHGLDGSSLAEWIRGSLKASAVNRK